jgi:outer membrane translocation and assembly module TamA
MKTSRLEDHPEFVQAIGMISIENSNLEDALAVLFSRVLQIGTNVGRAIYLTPKSAMARLEILQNASKEVFRPKTRPESAEGRRYRDEALKKVLALARRAEAVIGKRHAIMHDSWGFDLESGSVVRFNTVAVSEKKTVDLTSLQKLVHDLRQLMYEVDELARDLHIDAIP